MAIFVYKLQGTGNDFLLFDARESDSALMAQLKVSSRKDAVITLCNRQSGVGADGFIFIENSDQCDFKWDFYNSDGSSAEMCGNATRCVAVWAKDIAQIGNKVSFETVAGIIESDATDTNWVKTSMTEILAQKLDQQINIKYDTVVIDYIDSGVPHAVLTVDQITQDNDQFNLCKLIRENEAFKPKGANATLLKEISPGKIQSTSFERGVEGFTLACGTGAVAAAYSYYQKHNEHKIIEVSVPGGDLKVDFNDDNPKLIGPANLVAKIEILL